MKGFGWFSFSSVAFVAVVWGAGTSNSMIEWVSISHSSSGSVSSSDSDGNGLAVWSSRPVPSSEFVSVLTSSFRRFLRSSTSSIRCSSGSVI